MDPTHTPGASPRARQALARLHRHPVLVLHPLFFALYPLLGLYAHNLDKTPPIALIRPALVLGGGAMLVWLVLWALLRQPHRAGIITSVLVLTGLSGWSVLEFAIAWVTPRVDETANPVFYSLYALATAGGCYAIYRWRRRRPSWRYFAAGLVAFALLLPAIVEWLAAPAFGRGTAWMIAFYLLAAAIVVVYLLLRRGGFVLLTRTANWFSAALLGLSIINVAFNWEAPLLREPPELPLSLDVLEPSPDYPDIYVLTLDGYTGQDVLRNVYGYNNHPFLQSMTAKGFHVANSSFANYPSTLLSLTACMNFDYLHMLAPETARPRGDLRDVAELYHGNRLYRTLRRAGYDLIALPPGMELLEPRENVDLYMRPHDVLSEFEMVLANRTAAARTLQLWNYARHQEPLNLREVVERRRIHYVFDGLHEITQEEADRPRFVHAYVSVPGPPFLFNRRGGRADMPIENERQRTPFFQLSWPDYIRAYREQVHYANQELSQLVEAVFEQSPEPPVIVVTSTKGSGVLHPELATRPPSQTLANLTMVHIPGMTEQTQAALNGEVSLVNVFRIVLNDVFDTDLPLLDNETIWTSEDAPFSTGAEAVPE